MTHKDNHPRSRKMARWPWRPALLLALSAAPSLAAESTVPLTRFELEDVYKVCNQTHRPGPGMVPCLIEQAEKIARAKEIEQLAKHSEAATKKQIDR